MLVSYFLPIGVFEFYIYDIIKTPRLQIKQNFPLKSYLYVQTGAEPFQTAQLCVGLGNLYALLGPWGVYPKG